MTYYYYDKVLVTNCRLDSLAGYAGKMKKGSVVQLSAQLVGEDAVVLAAPEGISQAGDFYQAAFFGKVTYLIHKDGNLIRAYAADLSWVERTIMWIPASISALLQGKILLKGSFLRAREWAYILTGGEEEALLRPSPVEKAVMIAQRGGGYVGTAHICPGDSEVATETLALLGILVRQYDRNCNAIFEIEDPERKKNIILENIVGYRLFPDQLKQMAGNSAAIEKFSQEAYMAGMLVLQ